MLEKYKRFGQKRTGEVSAKWQGLGVRERSKRGAAAAAQDVMRAAIAEPEEVRLIAW